MQIEKATEENRTAILDLLRSQHLPTEDLPEDLGGFYTATENGDVVGVIGMEKYAQYGLLRSMAVHQEHRNRGIAAALVSRLERNASSMGIVDMYLLTETADSYFAVKGYRVILREEVPLELTRSSEFSHVCPASARVMKKDLNKPEYAIHDENSPL